MTCHDLEKMMKSPKILCISQNCKKTPLTIPDYKTCLQNIISKPHYLRKAASKLVGSPLLTSSSSSSFSSSTKSILLRASSLSPKVLLSSSSLTLLSSSSIKASPSSSYSTLEMTTTSDQTPTQQPFIEHIVLFKVKDEADPSQMLTSLNNLISLDQVLHLSAGSIARNRSSSFTFTHMLHSRYTTKEDLAAYSAHPKHMSVVKESVLPICEDIMAVDWVSSIANSNNPIVSSGSAMRVTLLKLKEGSEKGEVLGVIGGLKDRFEVSYGENFSPARAKGFSIASIGVFPGGLKELDGVDEEVGMKVEKDKVRDMLDSLIVVDYVVPPPMSATSL